MSGPVIEKAIPFGSIVDTIAGIFVLVILLTHSGSIVSLTQGIGGALSSGLNAVSGKAK